MKAIHITSVHPLFDTRIFLKECKTLAQTGYEVILVVQHEKDEVIDDIQIRSLPKPKNRLFRMTLTVFQAYRIAIKEDADIIHIHDPELLPLIFLLRLRGEKVVYDMHENVSRQILTKKWIHPFIRKPIAMLFSLLERFFLRKMPVVFAEESYLKDYQWVKKACTVLNMPIVDYLNSIRAEKKSISTLGYIGGVSRERGLNVTISALKILLNNRLHIKWECIGHSDVKAQTEINRFKGEFGDDVIIDRGRLSPSEGWPIISQCHIGLAVLQPIPNYIESYPTKIFEYMALGLPVIASNFPLYKKVIENTKCGICIDPENANELADAVHWLIEHPAEAEAMGKRGQRAVKDTYNWGREADKLIAFYASL